jgi:hypothetical protein
LSPFADNQSTVVSQATLFSHRLKKLVKEIMHYPDKKILYANKQPWDFPAAIGRYDNLYLCGVSKTTKAIRGKGIDLVADPNIRLTDADKPR